MTNVTIDAAQVDGGAFPIFNAGQSCELLAKAFVGDDTGAPVTIVRITIQTASGKSVCVNIPNSTANANVTVDGNQI